MNQYKPKYINNIRIIPMEPDEETIEEIQIEYFEDRLPNDEIFYFCFGKGINIEEDDLLLFQYSNHIVASAIGIKCNKTYGELSKLFKHHIILKNNSIKTFKPITQDELNIYIKRTLRNPSHFIKKNEVNNLAKFLDRLEEKR